MLPGNLQLDESEAPKLGLRDFAVSAESSHPALYYEKYQKKKEKKNQYSQQSKTSKNYTELNFVLQNPTKLMLLSTGQEYFPSGLIFS